MTCDFLNCDCAALNSIMPTYKRAPLAMVRGRGCLLYDTNGKEYLDLLAGVAVVSVGHAREEVVCAISEQAQQLIHTSNYFWNQPACQLSQKLNKISGNGYQVFFCNSGTEATECAIKLARKWGSNKGKHKIIAADRSFHGRTLAALAATGQPAKWEGFSPLPTGFTHCKINDIDAWDAAIDDSTAAILLEPIQGEGGIFPASKEFLSKLHKICSERNVLFMLDEIQTGCGRTGSWWAWQQLGVRPDVFLSAKGLANGIPIGACLARDKIATLFQPGTHGSTFGGGPVACAAALATLDVLEKNNYLTAAKVLGSYLQEALLSLPKIIEVRGMGLMIGAQLDSDISEKVTQLCFEKGLIVNHLTSSVIRITPPLCITQAQLDHAVRILDSVLRTL
jgi:acetylornithine/N-succinyldiaminopimelate aminotransferase